MSVNQGVYPKARYPRGHRLVAHDLNRIGFVLHHEGKYVEARRFLEQSVEMYERPISQGRVSTGPS